MSGERCVFEETLRDLGVMYPRTGARLLLEALESGDDPKRALFDELAEQGCLFPNSVAELLLSRMSGPWPTATGDSA